LEVFVNGAEKDKNQSAIERLSPTFAAVANAVQAVLNGGSEPVSWQRLMTGLSSDRRELRRFILTRPVLDFDELQPGGRARAEIRRLASELNIDPQHGLRVRLTGPVALNDEQFATLEQGAVGSTILSLVMVGVILYAAVRSVKLVLAMLVTVCAGLALNAGFAALAIGSLNLISVAFGVLFIGLGDDFGNQFSVLYRDQRHQVGSHAGALEGAAERMGPSILLAGAATAIGFLAFVPTSYVGVRELGWIAGFGMVVAVVLNLVLLPALLTLLRPPAEPEPVGFRWGSPVDRLTIVLEVARPLDDKACGGKDKPCVAANAAKPAATVIGRILGSRKQGWALAAALTYRTDGFAEFGGELEGSVLFSLARGGFHFDTNATFGGAVTDEAEEADGELKVRAGYDVTSWLRVGVDGRFRYRLKGAQSLPGNRLGDAVAGPELLFGYKHFFAAIDGGPSTVGISRGIGGTVLGTLGTAIW